ncbi:MAG: hypothetical protein ACYC5O_11605 [Anaerolineae bacterium]
MAEACIGELPALIESLPAAERGLVDRLLLVSAATGVCRVPETMRPWIEASFGSVAAAERQRVVRVTNHATLEGTLFNPLRAVRPMERAPVSLPEAIAASAGDPFCDAQSLTPEDVFGRVTGRYCVSASNVAKCEGAHGLIIFDRHDPLALSAERIADYFATARRWAERAHSLDGESVYPFLMWNCLWRGGASVVHGHAQVVLTREMHLPHIERWRRAGLSYARQYGGSYFDDLMTAHRSLGLAWEQGDVHGVAHLTPVKEHEVMLVARHWDEPLAKAVATVLEAFIGDLGVRSFNVAVWLPPLAPRPEDWSDFPVIARIVDRGDLGSRVSDMGAIELYGASVVASDPFQTASAVRARLRNADSGRA